MPAYVEDLTPFFKDGCWMFVLLAKRASVGVILRASRTITFTIRNVLATSREAAVNNSILDFAGVAEGSVASSARQ